MSDQEKDECIIVWENGVGRVMHSPTNCKCPRKNKDKKPKQVRVWVW